MTEEQMQAKAWAIYNWMYRNSDIPWVRRVGEIWLSKLKLVPWLSWIEQRSSKP